MLDYVEPGAYTMGERLKIYRKRCKMSQKELADLVKVSAATICNYENNKTAPDVKRLGDIAIALGITMNMLMHGCEPKREYEPIITE